MYNQEKRRGGKNKQPDRAKKNHWMAKYISSYIDITVLKMESSVFFSYKKGQSDMLNS